MINLEDGALYRFRVIAVNAAGESDPANVKEPIRAQERLGKFLFEFCPDSHMILSNIVLCFKCAFNKSYDRTS